MSTDSYRVQTVVIGAGVVGLAIARALSARGREVLVLEAGARFGEGISSRNSEVVHAGIYYPQGSLKAGLCVRGRRLLYEHCRSHKVPHQKCGKWIIASNPGQGDQLAGLRDQAAGNGVSLRLADGRQLRQQMPALNVCAGLWSPETGIVDSHALMLSLLGGIQDNGGQLALNSAVIAAESTGSGHTLRIAGPDEFLLHAREVINAAGLAAPGLAHRWQGLPGAARPVQWLARGVYFSYRGKHPFTTLVYPVPEPGGLGIHLTLDLAGQARFGPDVEWVDDENYTVDPGRSQRFAEGIRQWWPGLDPARLEPAYAGIRPKLSGPEGDFFDFRIDGPGQHGLPGLVNLFGIESPGLTASLAIAEHVSNLLGD